MSDKFTMEEKREIYTTYQKYKKLWDQVSSEIKLTGDTVGGFFVFVPTVGIAKKSRDEEKLKEWMKSEGVEESELYMIKGFKQLEALLPKERHESLKAHFDTVPGQQLKKNKDYQGEEK